MRLANISNGLAFPHDDVCYFQSQYGHHCDRCGYFRLDSMPYRAVLHLLHGGTVTIVDGTRRHKPLTDALRYGVPTWCLVFNRAIGRRERVCEWQTPEMERVANSDMHDALKSTIRKLSHIFPPTRSAIIGDNILLECHQGCIFDDKPRRLAEVAHALSVA
jgi:hypothetical protein